VARSLAAQRVQLKKHHVRLLCFKVLSLLSLGFLYLSLTSCVGVASRTGTALMTATTLNPPQPLAVAINSLPDASSGIAYTATLVGTGGSSPISWQLISGQLPGGVSLSPSGNIGGIPASVGHYAFTVVAIDSASPPTSVTANLSLTVGPSALAVSVPMVPPAVQGSSYNSGNSTGNGGAVLYISGGSAPYTCSVISGALPSGMTISEVTPNYTPAGLCIVSGTPTSAGDFAFMVQVADGISDLATQSVTLVVRSSSLPVISNVTETNITTTSATINWTTDVPSSSRVAYGRNYFKQETPEQDTGGVTSHSVNLTGLVSGYGYFVAVISRGISGGAPQDYLVSLDTINGGNSPVFTTLGAPSTGTANFGIELVGPHNIIQGFPLYVGISNGNISGTSNISSNGIRFQVTGIPPNSQVHWPDRQDFGSIDGIVTTTTTTDDTFLLGSQAFGTNREFEIETNIGGTTPPGNYILTLTVTAGSPPVTVTATWAMNVGTASFPSGSPSSQPSLPALSTWQSNMITYGNKWINGLGGNEGIDFYDGQWVYYQIGNYTSNMAYWNAGALNSRTEYRDQYAAPLNWQVPGYWVFPHGLYYDCVYNRNSTSCTALHGIAANAAGANMIANGFAAGDRAREASYMLGAKRLDYDYGGGTPLVQVTAMAAYVLGIVDQYVNDEPTSLEESFMGGLMAQALIEYYLDPKTGNRDVRIPPAVKALADHMWTNWWAPWNGKNGAFIYELHEANYGFIQFSPSGPLEGLNLLVAPMYEWLYKNTGLQQYQLEGDTIWYAGVTDPPSDGVSWTGKNFSQQYRWSFDYVNWRTQP